MRAVGPEDRDAWHILWDEYCAFYRVTVPAAVTQTLWHRLLDPGSPVNGLVAVGPDGHLLGLCHYVLHPHTWSARLVCYLEDLFTAGPWRGRGVGRALISHLRDMGVAAGWGRLYWNTEHDNHQARALYDKVAGGADGYVRYLIPLAPRG